MEFDRHSAIESLDWALDHELSSSLAAALNAEACEVNHRERWREFAAKLREFAIVADRLADTAP